VAHQDKTLTPDPPSAAAANPPLGLPATFVVVSMLIGLYAMAPGIWLGGLHVKRGAEIVDHVIPGLAVLAMILLAVSWRPGRSGRPTVLLIASLVIALAGLWMCATHVGLLVQGIRGEAPGLAVTYHCTTAFLTLVLGITWVARHSGVLTAPPVDEPGRVGE
jgi:hypothetical protein